MTRLWIDVGCAAVLLAGLIAYIAYRARKDHQRYVPPPEYSAPDPLYYSTRGGYEPLSHITYTPPVPQTIIVEPAPSVIIFEPVYAAAPEPSRFDQLYGPTAQPEHGDCGDSVADSTGTTDTWGGCDTGSGGDTQ